MAGGAAIRSLRLAAIFVARSTDGDELTAGEAGFEFGLLVDIFSLANRRSLAPLVSSTGDGGADSDVVSAFKGELLGVADFDFEVGLGGVEGTLNGDGCVIVFFKLLLDLVTGSGRSSLILSVTELVIVIVALSVTEVVEAAGGWEELSLLPFA